MHPLCVFGFHRWVWIIDNSRRPKQKWERCKRCPMTRDRSGVARVWYSRFGAEGRG